MTLSCISLAEVTLSRALAPLASRRRTHEAVCPVCRWTVWRQRLCLSTFRRHEQLFSVIPASSWCLCVALLIILPCRYSVSPCLVLMVVTCSVFLSDQFICSQCLRSLVSSVVHVLIPVTTDHLVYLYLELGATPVIITVIRGYCPAASSTRDITTLLTKIHQHLRSGLSYVHVAVFLFYLVTCSIVDLTSTNYPEMPSSVAK